jgi:hypothetical protein
MPNWKKVILSGSVASLNSLTVTNGITGSLGTASLIALVSFTSGLVLLTLGIIAEYIWRIWDEVNNRPDGIEKFKN